MRNVDMAQTPTKTRSRTRKSGSLLEVKSMVGMLKSLYSPAQLREIVAGLGLPADDPAGSGEGLQMNIRRTHEEYSR
jgi:hypothetical protein